MVTGHMGKHLQPVHGTMGSVHGTMASGSSPDEPEDRLCVAPCSTEMPVAEVVRDIDAFNPQPSAA